MRRCRACDRPIRWARTTNGKPIPLDDEPDPKGNVTLEGETAIVHGKNDDLEGQERYMPHHATCPNWGRR